MKKPYLFVSLLVAVFAAETLVFYYTRIETPSLTPAVEEKRVYIKLSSLKPAPPPEPVCRCAEQPRPEPPVRPKPVIKPKPKPKPVVKPKQKPKPKPKPVVKPKPKPVTKPEQKPQKEKVAKQPKPAPQKVAAAKTPKPVVKAPASKPNVSAQKVEKEKIEKIKAAYLMAVREKIERNKYYPRSAKKLRQTGTVELKFTILKDGTIGRIAVVSGCRYGRLNKAAVKTLERIGCFAPLPNVFESDQLTLKVPINYKLMNR